MLFSATQILILVIVRALQQYFCLRPSLTRRIPVPAPFLPPLLPSSKWCRQAKKLPRRAICGRRPVRAVCSTNHAGLLVYLHTARNGGIQPAGEESGNGGSPDSSKSSPEQLSTAPADLPSADTRTPLREEESRLRAESETEQPPSDSEARQRRRSPNSVGRHGLVSPSSAARQPQGSYWGRDARDDSVDTAAEAERTRRALEVAQATTPA